MRKILGWAVVAVIAFYVVKNPSGAASTLRGITDGVYLFLSGLAAGGGQ